MKQILVVKNKQSREWRMSEEISFFLDVVILQVMKKMSVNWIELSLLQFENKREKKKGWDKTVKIHGIYTPYLITGNKDTSWA